MIRRSARGTRCAAVVAVIALSTACGSVDNRQRYPSDVVDLSNWKLALSDEGGASARVAEIRQPELNEFTDADFELSDGGDGIVFRASAGGAIQSGSEFSRTELREMVNDGRDPARWSNLDGVHTLVVRQAITRLTEKRPSIVAGQIHDADRYVVLVRLDGNRLYVKSGGATAGVLDDNYALGTPFTLRLEASNGQISVSYNDRPPVRVDYECESCYFKVGAYLQTNTSWGESGSDFAEVVITDLAVDHTVEG